MTSKDLEELGFKEIDENEYSNDKFVVFLLDNNQVSIIGEDADNFLSIPQIKCNDKKEFISLFKLMDYDIQSKD